MATRTIAVGGGNWSAGGTWVELSAPTASDDVVATILSGNVTVDTTTCVAKTVDLTGYIGLLTFTAAKTLTVSGNVKFVAGMTLAGTGTLAVNATATLTSGALTFPGALTLNSASTYTLADNWVVTGTFSSPFVTVLNSNALTCNGSFTTAGGISGTTNITLGGTGTWSGSGNVANNITFNSAGTITISGTVLYATGTLTYTAGTMVVTSSMLQLAGNCTLATSGMTWNDVRFTGITITLTQNLNLAGILFMTNTGNANPAMSGNFDISCGTLSMTDNTNFRLVSGRTLNVSSSISMVHPTAGSGIAQTCHLRSVTSSSAAFLHYTGTTAGLKIIQCSFTDIDASSSSVPIWNYFGGNPDGVLTRTTNIVNMNLPIPVLTDLRF